jgi:CBS domain-containing protein
MATAGSLATAHPVQVHTTTPIIEAARFMRDLGIGVVVVTDPDSGELLGMLSDRDVAVRLVPANLDPELALVEEFFTPEVTAINASDGVEVAIDKMREASVRRLPVLDDAGALVGILSVEDLAGSGHVDDAAVGALLRELAHAYRIDRVSSADQRSPR